MSKIFCFDLLRFDVFIKAMRLMKRAALMQRSEIKVVEAIKHRIKTLLFQLIYDERKLPTWVILVNENLDSAPLHQDYAC